MKKLLLVLMLVLFPVFCFAATNVTFEWDANTESDLAGYRLYQSATSGTYTFGPGNEVGSTLSGTETVTIQVEDGLWYWVLTAYNTAGIESDPSNEVSNEPPGPPTGFRITIIINIE